MAGLTDVERYATAGLFALALSEAQRHQLGDYMFYETDTETPAFEALWSSKECGLCEHVFRYMNLDQRASENLHRIVTDPEAQIHLSAFLQILASEEKAEASEVKEAEIELEKAVEAISLTLEEEQTQRVVAAVREDSSSAGAVKQGQSAVKSEACQPSNPDWADYKTEGSFAVGSESRDGGAHFQEEARQVEQVQGSEPNKLAHVGKQKSSNANDGEYGSSAYRLTNSGELAESAASDVTAKQSGHLASEDCQPGAATGAGVCTAASVSSVGEGEEQERARGRGSAGTRGRPSWARGSRAHTESASRVHLEASDSDKIKDADAKDNGDEPLEEGETEAAQPEETAEERMARYGVPRPEIASLSQHTRVRVIYELLAACLADLPEEEEGKSGLGPGYDARQRVALRLIAAWLDITWSKVVSMEYLVAYAAYKLQKEREAAAAEEQQKKSLLWSWKKGAIVGGTAVAAGAILAITGGLAAPAIAAGLAAVSPSVAVVPILGTAFAGFATAAGTTVGSVAVISAFGAAGAGLGGYKMSRRIGDVEEFQFVELGTGEESASSEPFQKPDSDSAAVDTENARQRLSSEGTTDMDESAESNGGAGLASPGGSQKGQEKGGSSHFGKRWSWANKGRKQGGLETGQVSEQGQEAQLAEEGRHLEGAALEDRSRHGIGGTEGQGLLSGSARHADNGEDSEGDRSAAGGGNQGLGKREVERASSKKWRMNKWTSRKERQMQDEIGKEFRPRLGVAICVSGFVRSLEEYTEPWGEPNSDLETYALLYESRHLIPLSTALEDMLTNTLVQKSMTQGAMLTVLSTLVTAMAWPLALVAALNMIDSRWTLAVDRSDKAGKILADVLLKHTHGDRPVTLIGYSMGARVIFSCLEQLAAKKAYGIVERAVLLGAPVPAKDPRWAEVRKVVAGRFVNGYNSSDWTLGLVYRSSFVISGVAGIQEVDTPGIENVDITALLKRGHSSYCSKLKLILAAIDIDSYFPAFPTKVVVNTSEEEATIKDEQS